MADPRSSAGSEHLIERLIQAAVEYENNCDKLVSKNIRIELEKAKQAIRDAITFNDAQAVVAPAAWRWKPRRSRHWITCDKLPEFTEDADVITEALFAAQPPAAPGETCKTCQGDGYINVHANLPDVACPDCTSQPHSSAGKESEPPEHQLAGRDCPGVLESDPALFNILNNALGTMHYHRLMSALNWNGYVITREPQTSGVWQPIETAPQDGSRILGTGGGLADQVEVVTYNERVGCWNAETCTLDDTDQEPQGYNRPTLWQPLPSSPLPRPERATASGADASAPDQSRNG